MVLRSLRMRLLPEPHVLTKTLRATLCVGAFVLLPYAFAAPLPQATPAQAAGQTHETHNAQAAAALTAAAASGDVSLVNSLLGHGSAIDATDASGRTALIAAVQNGQVEAARTLVRAGANLNIQSRALGSALNVAENDGDTALAAMLQAAGATTTGKSVGDTVCVTPWGGQGFCGTVKVFTVREVRIDVTKLVGCEGGCPARPECSAGNPVGGVNGLHMGETIQVPSWCLTRTGVKQ
jgi:hypothetical protein